MKYIFNTRKQENETEEKMKELNLLSQEILDNCMIFGFIVLNDSHDLTWVALYSCFFASFFVAKESEHKKSEL